jgi:peptidyl-prolyl cis-trans isomerase A (cyclophilin A)
MNMKTLRVLLIRIACTVLIAGTGGLPGMLTAEAGTVVRFSTSSGAFDVQLSDDPAVQTTVQNFLAYVEADAYTNSIIHRSTTYEPDDIQILQGGGFFLDGNTVFSIPTVAPIPLQASIANTRGTIAMARTPDPDSATSGWFFNLVDNAALDFQYAVFGSVINTLDNPGLAVLDAIGALEVYNAAGDLGPDFGELPLYAPSLTVGSLVLVNSIAPVPEPSTWALAGIGLAAAAWVTRRHRTCRG